MLTFETKVQAHKMIAYSQQVINRLCAELDRLNAEAGAAKIAHLRCLAERRNLTRQVEEKCDQLEVARNEEKHWKDVLVRDDDTVDREASPNLEDTPENTIVDDQQNPESGEKSPDPQQSGIQGV